MSTAALPIDFTQQYLTPTFLAFSGSIGADTYTLYIADPVWTDELRLVFHQGLLVPEAMYGFLPKGAKKVVVSAVTEFLCQDARLESNGLRDPKRTPTGVSRRIRWLFGDFVDRERIRSTIRLTAHERASGNPRAVLFVGFRQKRRLSTNSKEVRTSRQLFAALLGKVSRLQKHLRSEAFDTLFELAQIFSPSNAVAQVEPSKLIGRSQYFSEVLRLALAATKADRSDGLATLHLVDRDKVALVLAGHCGTIEDTESAARARFDEGRGIISWAFVREGAVLVEDVRKGAFKDLYVPLKKSTRTQLAVPVQVGGETIGVVSLESSQRGAFCPRMVRSIWYAANKAAVAYMMYEARSQSDRTTDLLHGVLNICGRAVTGESSDALVDLATLVRAQAGASDVEVVPYDYIEKRFQAGGATYSSNQPREGGWTDHVALLGTAVWIDATQGGDRLLAQRWAGGEWAELPSEPEIPSLHPTLEGKSWRYHLGLVISATKRCNGVMWLRYKAAELPTPSEMKIVLRLADQSSLVLECMNRDREMAGQKIVERYADQIATALFRNRDLRFAGFPWIDGAVDQQPDGAPIGGDFWAAELIDDRNLGVVLGDAQHHGIAGAMNMLPLVSAWRTNAKASRSPVPMLERLAEAAAAVNTTCAAICFVLTHHSSKMYLTAAAAGESTLLVVRDGQELIRCPGRADLWGRTVTLGYPLDAPFMQESIELFEGDVLVAVTDGVSDCFGSLDEIADLVRRVDQLIRTPDRVVADIKSRALAESKRRNVPSDDMTIMAIRVGSLRP